MNVWLGCGVFHMQRERERGGESNCCRAQNQIEMCSGCVCVRVCVCKAKSKYLCFMLMRICLTFCHLNIGKRPLPLPLPPPPQQLVVLCQKNDKCVGALWLALPVSLSANSSNCNCSLSCLWFCESNDHAKTRRGGMKAAVDFRLLTQLFLLLLVLVLLFGGLLTNNWQFNLPKCCKKICVIAKMT